MNIDDVIVALSPHIICINADYKYIRVSRDGLVPLVTKFSSKLTPIEDPQLILAGLIAKCDGWLITAPPADETSINQVLQEVDRASLRRSKA